MIRPQLDALPKRVRDGRHNHDYVAARLNRSPFLEVPEALDGETRAPDSIQFNLLGFGDAETDVFVRAAGDFGVKVQVFGRSTDNARAFWNWQFIEDLPELPATREMLMRACDVRLPVRLTHRELDTVVDALTRAVEASGKRPEQAVA